MSSVCGTRPRAARCYNTPIVVDASEAGSGRTCSSRQTVTRGPGPAYVCQAESAALRTFGLDALTTTLALRFSQIHSSYLVARCRLVCPAQGSAPHIGLTLSGVSVWLVPRVRPPLHSVSGRARRAFDRRSPTGHRRARVTCPHACLVSAPVVRLEATPLLGAPSLSTASSRQHPLGHRAYGTIVHGCSGTWQDVWLELSAPSSPHSREPRRCHPSSSRSYASSECALHPGRCPPRGSDGPAHMPWPATAEASECQACQERSTRESDPSPPPSSAWRTSAGTGPRSRPGARSWPGARATSPR